MKNRFKPFEPAKPRNDTLMIRDPQANSGEWGRLIAIGLVVLGENAPALLCFQVEFIDKRRDCYPIVDTARYEFRQGLNTTVFGIDGMVKV